MALLLHLETATKRCSVSLSDGFQLVACKELSEENFNHAEKLHVFIEEILKENNYKFSDLSAICVSKGPGSYTGLRIGVSSAKGLAYTLDIPLISINTLEVLARQLKIENGTIIPMIDARRMEVFTAHYSTNYDCIKETYALVLETDSFDAFEGVLHFVGDGATKCKEMFSDGRFVYHDDIVYPSSKNMIELGFQKFIDKDFEDTAYFEPFYLKDFLLTTKK